MRYTPALVIASIVVASGSCDKQASDGEKSAATGTDLCKLVTASEVGALLGGTPDEPRRIDNKMANVCTYARAGGEVRIMKTTLPDPAAFKPDKNALDAGAETIAGIGDEAFVLAGAFDMIAFRKGLVQISLFVAEPQGVADTSRQTLIDMGTRAATRL